MKITISIKDRSDIDKIEQIIRELALDDLQINYSFLPQQLDFPFDLPIVAVEERGYPVRHGGEAAFEFLRKLAA